MIKRDENGLHFCYNSLRIKLIVTIIAFIILIIYFFISHTLKCDKKY